MDNVKQTLSQQALTHMQAGQEREAIAALERAVHENPDDPEAPYMLGCLISRQNTARAIELIQRSVQIRPGPDTLLALGKLYQNDGRYSEAVASYDRALELTPDLTDAAVRASNLLEWMDFPEEALTRLQRLLAVTSNRLYALNLIGNLFARLGLFDQAIAFYLQALKIEPTDLYLVYNLAMAMKCDGQLEGSIQLCRQLVVQRPDNAEFHHLLATALLTTGKLEEGYHEYRWRWKTENLKNYARTYQEPYWDGQDITGKTLLIHGEQGFGDTLQFCRYAAMVHKRNIRVLIEVPAPLARLVRSLPGVDAVVSAGEPLPAFDYHCAVIDLAAIFKTTLDNIPGSTPYLFADRIDLAHWEKIIPAQDGVKKIGFVWAGNPRRESLQNMASDRRRSVSLDVLKPLMDVPGFSFYSLQKAYARPPDDSILIDLMDQCNDFADTAALIMQMDLVICIDTSVVHLAGALGKPVWMMSPVYSCWRWMLNREDSPWYPTLRLFRQTKRGDWGDVVDRMKEALHHL